MEQIINYQLEEFLKQDENIIEDYVQLLSFLSPKKTKKNIINLTFREVEEIKKGINDENELIPIISIIEDIKEDDVLKMKILDFFPLVKDVQKQVIDLINREQNNLAPKYSDARYEMVGAGERLQKFGVYNSVNSLANGDILKFNQILDMPYSEVFVKLLLDKEIADINYEINKIKPINN